MKSSSFASALLAFIVAHDQVPTAFAAGDNTDTDAQLVENVVSECKGRFLNALTILYPEDEPGRALDSLSTTICLDYSSFLPCKCE